MDPLGEEGIRFLFAQIFKWQNGDGFLRSASDLARSLAQGEFIGQQQNHGHGQHRNDPAIDVSARLARLWL